MIAVPDKEEILRYLSNARERVKKSLYNKLDSYKSELNKYKTNYLLNNPIRLYEMKEQKLDILYDKINDSINKIIDRNSNLIDTLKIKLDLLNPVGILDKGYSIMYKDNKIIKDINDISLSDDISIMVKNGSVIANVKDIKKKDVK